jgi:hypothetical protein
MRESCTCDASGEDPHCPHHGYEAVIARFEAALTEINDFAAAHCPFDDADWIMERVERAFTSPPHAAATEGEQGVA